MNFWVITAIILGAIFFIFTVYGLMQPRKWEVRKQRRIPAPAADLFLYLTHLPNWEQWTAWNRDSDQQYRYTYEGPLTGEGAVQHWKTKKQSGTVKIVSTESPHKIEFQFGFGRGKHKVDGQLTLVEQEGGTELTWEVKGDAGESPGGRVMAKMMKPYMEKDFQTGLDRLERLATEKRLHLPHME